MNKLKTNKTAMAIAGVAVIGLGYMAITQIKKPVVKKKVEEKVSKDKIKAIVEEKKEMLMASKQAGGKRKEFPMVLYPHQSWQGSPYALSKNELILIMEQHRSESGEITRKWHYNSFKTDPKKHIRLSSDEDNGKSVRTVNTFVGFNTPSISDFIFNDSKIFGAAGLDLNSARTRSVKVYLKVIR